MLLKWGPSGEMTLASDPNGEEWEDLPSGDVDIEERNAGIEEVDAL
jgi:hypothetical protein